MTGGQVFPDVVLDGLHGQYGLLCLENFGSGPFLMVGVPESVIGFDQVDEYGHVRPRSSPALLPK